ncbi:MAG: hypothetical protein WD767_20080 [Alphaproteobacteria bacterium]
MGGTEALIAGLTFLRTAQEARAKNRELAAQQTLQERNMAAEREIADRRHAEKLHKDKATRRALFGAAGTSSGAGSAAAVLRGLSKRSAHDRFDRNRLDTLQLQGLRQAAASQRRKNLLAPADYLFGQAMYGLGQHGPEWFGEKKPKK